MKLVLPEWETADAAVNKLQSLACAGRFWLDVASQDKDLGIAADSSMKTSA